LDFVEVGSKQYLFGTDVTDRSVGNAYMRSLLGIHFPAPSEENEHPSNIRVICVFRLAEPVPMDLMEDDNRGVFISWSDPQERA